MHYGKRLILVSLVTLLFFCSQIVLTPLAQTRWQPETDPHLQANVIRAVMRINSFQSAEALLDVLPKSFRTVMRPLLDLDDAAQNLLSTCEEVITDVRDAVEPAAKTVLMFNPWGRCALRFLASDEQTEQPEEFHEPKLPRLATPDGKAVYFDGDGDGDNDLALYVGRDAQNFPTIFTQTGDPLLSAKVFEQPLSLPRIGEVVLNLIRSLRNSSEIKEASLLQSMLGIREAQAFVLLPWIVVGLAILVVVFLSRLLERFGEAESSYSFGKTKDEIDALDRQLIRANTFANQGNLQEILGYLKRLEAAIGDSRRTRQGRERALGDLIIWTYYSGDGLNPIADEIRDAATDALYDLPDNPSENKEAWLVTALHEAKENIEH